MKQVTKFDPATEAAMTVKRNLLHPNLFYLNAFQSYLFDFAYLILIIDNFNVNNFPFHCGTYLIILFSRQYMEIHGVVSLR